MQGKEGKGGSMVDRGWADMHATLEREMPRKKKRRALIVLVGASVAATVLVLLVFKVGIFSGSPRQPGSSEMAEVVLIEEDRAVLSTADVSVYDSTTRETDASDAHSLAMTSVTTGLVEVRTSSTAVSNPDTEINPFVEIESHQQDEQSATPVVIVVALTEGTERVKSEETGDVEPNHRVSPVNGSGEQSQPDDPAVNDARKADTRESWQFSMLRTRDASIMDQSATSSRVVATLVVPHGKNRTTFHLDAMGNTHWAAPLELRGLEGGLMASLDFGRRIQVGLGASYGHYRTGGLIDGFGLQNESADLASVPQDMNAPMTPGFSQNVIDLADVDYDTALILIEKFNYFHFPVQVGYRINGRLTAYLGVKFAHLLSSPADINAEVARNSLGSQFTVRSNILTDQGILRKWDVAPTLGMSWSCGRHWSLHASYNFGLIAYIDLATTEKREDYHRTLSIGMQYRIR